MYPPDRGYVMVMAATWRKRNHPEWFGPARAIVTCRTYNDAQQLVAALERYDIPGREVMVSPLGMRFVPSTHSWWALLALILCPLLGACVGALLAPGRPAGGLALGVAPGALVGLVLALAGCVADYQRRLDAKSTYLVAKGFDVLVNPSHIDEAFRALAAIQRAVRGQPGG